MTIAEFIKELKRLPQDTPVYLRSYEDYFELLPPVLEFSSITDELIISEPTYGKSNDS